MDSDDGMIADRPARPRGGCFGGYVALTAAAVTLLVVGAAGGIAWNARYGFEPRAKRAAPARDAQPPAASPRGGAMPRGPGTSAAAGQGGPAQGEEGAGHSLLPAALQRGRVRIAQ